MRACLLLSLMLMLSKELISKRCPFNFSLFFFSSRSRHTRSLCDWSSDVCSSDLVRKLSSNGTDSRIVHSCLQQCRTCQQNYSLVHLFHRADYIPGLPADLPQAQPSEQSICRRSEEHTSELQSHSDLLCRLLLEKKKKNNTRSRGRRDNASQALTEPIQRRSTRPPRSGRRPMPPTTRDGTAVRSSTRRYESA